MTKNKLARGIVGALAFGSLFVGAIASADTDNNSQNNNGEGWGRGGMMKGDMMKRVPGVFGTVASISGSTLTVTSKNKEAEDGKPVTATYTVDASKATVTKNGAASTLANIAVGDVVMVEGTVSGTSVTATAIRSGMMMGGRGMGREGHGILGTVASVSGSSLTVTSKKEDSNTTTTYTVDASKATVTKNGAASSLANIAVGDMVMVQGAISGTTVTANMIMDGLPQGQMMKGGMIPPNSIVKGDGQPIVGGNITAINGSALTITNKSNVTYTVNAGAALIVKNNATSSISALAVGDSVIVQGAVNGNTITASSVINQGVQPAAPTTQNNDSKKEQPRKGFFGAIGGFFHNLFGFF